MSWRYPDYFVIGREQVRSFAAAVQYEHRACFDEDAAAELGYDNIVAPLTFASILAKLVQTDFFRNVDVGLETMQIVQVDQKFLYYKPMFAGDRIFASMEVDSVEERFGAAIVVTKNVCTNQHGQVVLEGYTTLMGHQGDNSIQLKWDKETGQVMRTA